MLNILISLSFWIICDLQTQMTDAKKGFGPGEQDWGYIQIRESSQMFWWLFYVNPQNKSESFNVYDKPLLIWLQGGPGNSASGFGNFVEIGPLDVNLKPRIHSWVNEYNVLFIDSPIGTGFSYEESEQEITLSDEQITEDLIEFMNSFIANKPKFLKTPVYVLGESYGGKMAANFVWGWWKNQQYTTATINLKGIALYSPWISPVDSVRALPAYLFNLGLLDNTEYIELETLAESVINTVDRKDWLNAYNLWNNTLRRSLTIMNHENLYNVLDIIMPTVKARDYFTDDYEANILDTNKTVNLVTQLEHLMNEKVKQTLNLEGFNDKWKIMNWQVYEKLKNQIFKSATHTVDRILSETNLKVFVLAGQLDLIVPISGTLRWVEKLKWNCIEHWKNVTKISFSVNNILEGYVKEYKKLKFFWILKAGHMLPGDNPQAMIAILKDLTS